MAFLAVRELLLMIVIEFDELFVIGPVFLASNADVSGCCL